MRLCKWVPIVILLSVLSVFCGCGGNSVTPDTNIKADISWAVRGRDISAPAAALSCKIELYRPVLLNPTSAQSGGGNMPLLNAVSTSADTPVYQWIINRQTDPAAYIQHWASPDQVPAQKWRVVVSFTSEANGAGSVVGTADYVVQIMDDGTGIGNIVVNHVIASLEVQASQTVAVGEHKVLSFIARSAQGAVVAITPDSVRWEVGPPEMGITEARTILPEMLRYQDGEAVGVSTGSPTVRVVMDSLNSPWMTVVVYDPAPVIPLMRCTRWRVTPADGQWIFFAGGVDGNMDIYRVRPDGTGIVKYTTVGKNIMQFDITPDLQTIVFDDRRAADGSGDHIMKIKSDGTGLTELVPATNRHPVIMNATEVLFDSGGYCTASIHLDGGQIRVYPPFFNSEGRPYWQAAVGSYPERILLVGSSSIDWQLGIRDSNFQFEQMLYSADSSAEIGSPCFNNAGSQVIVPNDSRTRNPDALEISIVDIRSHTLNYPFTQNSFENADGVSAGPAESFSFIGKRGGLYGLYTSTTAGSDLKRVFPAEAAN